MKEKQNWKRIRMGVLTAFLLGGLLSGCAASDLKGTVTSVEQLNDPAYIIGVPEGAASMVAAEKACPQAEMKYYSRDADAYLAVQQGKIDAFAYDRVMLEFAIGNGLEGVRVLPENIGEPMDIAVGLSPKSPIPDLEKKVNQFLEEIEADGTLEDMYRRWVIHAEDTIPADIPVPAKPELILRVGTTGLVQPFSYYKGDQLNGYDIEMITRFASYLNAGVEIKTYDYGGIVAAAESGAIDCIMANLNATKERRQQIPFSRTIYESYSAVLVRDDVAGGRAADGAAASRAALEHASYGVMTGSTAEIYIGKTYPDAKISTYSSIADAFLALSGGKIDYVLTAYTTALNAVRSNPELEIYQKDVIEEASSIAVAKGNTRLLEEIDGVLEQFRTDGTLEQVVANWTTVGQDYVIPEIPKPEASDDVLRVAIAADREPMCFVMDGQYRGLDCELIERIAAELGKTVEYQNMQFSSLVAALASAKADVIISNMTATEERRQSVDFTQPYFDNPQVLVARAVRSDAASLEFDSLEELEGHPISVLSGSAFDQKLEAVIDNPTIVYYNSMSDEIQALKGGKVDATVLDEPMAKLAVSKHTGIGIMPEVLVEDHYGLALTKDNPLTEQINEIIAGFRADGTLSALEDKWFGADDTAKSLPELDYPGNGGTLRFVHDNTSEPMSYVGSDGNDLGYDVELVMLAARKLDMKLEISSANFDALIPMLQSRKADIAAGCFSITPERKAMVDLTDPYFDGSVVLVARSIETAAEGKESLLDSLSGSFTRTFVTEGRWKLIVSGLVVTVVISILSGLFGSVLGFGICMLRRSKQRAAAGITAAFIRIIQGTPIVVLLMILYYVIFGTVDVSAIAISILGFSVNFAVYVSEMMRTGIDAVDGGQLEASLALGYTRIQTFKKVTFPQAARHFLPVFKGEFISMVKMTSVVGYIAVQDLTKVSDIIRSRTLEAFFPLIVTAILYFLIANILASILSLIEFRLDPKRRPRTLKGVTKA